MPVSTETPEAIQKRMLGVMAELELEVFPGAYVYEELPAGAFPKAVKPEALAVVRDGKVWSQLVPAAAPGGVQFKMFCFHFPATSNNSGFTGWLAGHLKKKTGAGVLVVCGQNNARGGIYDYWGCSTGAADEVIAELRELIARGKSAGK